MDINNKDTLLFNKFSYLNNKLFNINSSLRPERSGFKHDSKINVKDQYLF